MSSPVINMLSGYFSEELTEERDDMRTSLLNGGPAGVEGVRSSFRTFLRDRTMTHDEFRRATSARFDDDEKLYAAAGDAYRFFLDGEPPGPVTERRGS